MVSRGIQGRQATTSCSKTLKDLEITRGKADAVLDAVRIVLVDCTLGGDR